LHGLQIGAAISSERVDKIPPDYTVSYAKFYDLNEDISWAYAYFVYRYMMDVMFVTVLKYS